MSPVVKIFTVPRLRRWILLLGFVAATVWLNGPGLRWVGPHVAEHFLSKAGLRGTFELEGSLTGGLVLKNLRLESDKTMASITVEKLIPEYRLSRLMKGRVDDIAINGIHVELHLGREDDRLKKKKDPHALENMVKSLRAVRARVIQLDVNLENITLRASRDGKPVISLAKSSIRHNSGEPNIDVEIGEITDATGRLWPARKTSIVWKEDELKIDRLDPLPGISLRNFALHIPQNGEPSAETELDIDEATFLVSASPGLSSLQINLLEGRLVSDTVARRFAMKLPVAAELSSFSANVENLLPDPKAAIGSAQLLLEDVTYQDWTLPELSLDVELEAGQATLAARGTELGSEVSLSAVAAVDRTGGAFLLGETRGHFNVTEIDNLVTALADRIEAIDPDAPVPASIAEGDFHFSFTNNRADFAEINVRLKPTEPEVASALLVKVSWQPDKVVSAQVVLDGLDGNAQYDLGRETYMGTVKFEKFNTARIGRWLSVLKVGTHGKLLLTGNWSGGGSTKEMLHHGTFEMAAAEFVRDGMPPIHAHGAIQYDWPMGFTTQDLLVTTGDQRVTVDLKLADGFLQMSNLLWKDGDIEMASGTAKLPAPDNFSMWREMLASDVRPLTVAIDSKTLSLAKLNEWIPAAGKIDPRSTGRIGLKATGTYANPHIDAVVDIRELRATQKSDLPPADLELKVVAHDGHVSLDGHVIVPNYPPAEITASMPFRPAEWAEKPGLVMHEKITARMDIPRIDLSRFSSLIPGVKKISGALSGNFVADGEIRKPQMKGEINLTGGAVEMAHKAIPPVTGLTAALDLSPEKITLSKFKATVAGGTLDAQGSLAIEDGKPGRLDIRLNGDHLPLKRDESLIVRATADLRVVGTWEQAAVTGTVGVVDSMFFRDIEILPIGKPFTVPAAAELPRIDTPKTSMESLPEPFRNWTLNVAAKTLNPFLVRGNFATGNAEGGIRVGGTIGKPAPTGVLKISDFKASLPFSTLVARSGKLIFTPDNGFDPVLEIRGTAEPRPYRVNVYVYGLASDPQLMLTSSPPLPENEIMTLLATGSTTSGLEDPQAASSRALQLLIEELRRGRFGFGKRLRPLLAALDRVDFTLAEKDPYSSETFSTATVTLTDHWYLTAGMGEEGNSRILAMWRLRFY